MDVCETYLLRLQIITVFFDNIFVFVQVPLSPLWHSPVEGNPRRAAPLNIILGAHYPSQ